MKFSASLAGAVAAALGATACCTLPLLLVAAGVGGAWVSTLESIQPARPAFVLVAALLLYLADRRLEKNEVLACEGGTCPTPDVRRRQRRWLRIVIAVTFFLLLSPALVRWVL
jgi:mercuric ion transport protein